MFATIFLCAISATNSVALAQGNDDHLKPEYAIAISKPDNKNRIIFLESTVQLWLFQTLQEYRSKLIQAQTSEEK